MIKKFIAAAFITVFLAFPAAAQNTPVLKIENAYAFATVPVQKNGAVFLSVQNNGTANVSITGVKTDKAEKVELHTMSMKDNVMQMRHVEKFEIKSGETFSLTPMGDHIMLMGLKAPLKAGETFPVTLSTDGGDVAVDVEIVPPGTKP